jgi:hypothetical protein
MRVNKPNLKIVHLHRAQNWNFVLIITRILGTVIEDKMFENKGGKRFPEFNIVLTSSFISINNNCYYLSVHSAEGHDKTT